jgi:hypothetical protein
MNHYVTEIIEFLKLYSFGTFSVGYRVRILCVGLSSEDVQRQTLLSVKKGSISYMKDASNKVTKNELVIK